MEGGYKFLLLQISYFKLALNCPLKINESRENQFEKKKWILDQNLMWICHFSCAFSSFFRGIQMQGVRKN